MYLFPINCGVFSTNFLNQLSILSFILSSFNYNTLFLFCQATIGASLEASIPTTETYLVNINEDYTTVNETRTVHIPSGVKVLKVRVYSESGAGGDDFCTAHVQNADNKKVWVIAENYGSCDETKYVGVTGGKDYKLNLYAGTEYDTMAALIRISYSQSINNTTPSVTDY